MCKCDSRCCVRCWTQFVRFRIAHSIEYNDIAESCFYAILWRLKMNTERIVRIGSPSETFVEKSCSSQTFRTIPEPACRYPSLSHC